MKRFSSFLVALFLATIAHAYDFQAGDLYYNILSDGTAEVTFQKEEYSDNYVDLTSATIPSSVIHNGTTYMVTGIGEGAFSHCTGLTSVTIPNSVTSIGHSAFSGCEGLTSITIGNGVTTIGGYAFSYCIGLTSITIPNSVTTIGGHAFYNCTGLTSITIPNSVTTIGEKAFSYCTGLTSITIPNSVTTIGGHAFYNCKRLTSITIPNSVTTIGNSAFNGTLWYEDQPDGVVYINNVLYDYKGTMPANTSIVVKEGTVSIGGGAFEGCTGLTSIAIPNSVKDIGWYAFKGCTGLTSITIPDSVTSIEDGTFYNCTGLSTIVIPNSVTSIKDETFYNCKSLISITIPNGVVSIGDGAFSWCTGLTSITIPNSVTNIGDSAFKGCAGLISLIVGNSVTSIGEKAFEGCTDMTSIVWNVLKYDDAYTADGAPFISICDNITSFTFGEDVEHIPAYLCYGMSQLTSIVIPNSVTNIGEGAFCGCSGITSITIPESVTSVGTTAFQNCTSLTSVTIGENITNLPSDIFRYSSNIISVVWNAKNFNISSNGNPFYQLCNNITSFTFGDKVDSIPAGLCEKMTKLSSIIIPESVKSIGASAFSECTNLTSAVVGGGVTEIGNNAFDGCTGLTDVNLPNGVKTIGDNAFYNCYGITSISIPNSVTSIGKGAFFGCSGITSIIIPESVTSVGTTAFQKCTSLTSVVWNVKRCNDEYNGTFTPFYHYYAGNNSSITSFTFGDNVESIPANLCRGLSSLTDVTIPENVASIGRNAFYNCLGITSVVWNAKKCGDWGDSPFRDARRTITSFTFGDKVESIPDYLCYEMSKLSSITIPESVTGIGAGAFALCDLTSCTLLSETPPAIDNGTFGYDSSMPITVPCGAAQAYRDAWDSYNNFIEPAPQYTLTVYPQNYEMGDIQFLRSYSCSNDTAIMYASSYGGFQFARWDDGNTDNPRTVVVTSDTSFVAYYTTEQYTIYTEVSDAERGSVSDAVTANYLDYVTISATANDGYHFARWDDDNTDNPRSVQVIGNNVYTAFFDKNTYSVTVLSANEAHGSATTDAPQAEYKDIVTLTAAPNTGYQFVQWNDGNTDNPRTVILTCDTTLTAEFSLAYSGQCGDDLYWKYDNRTLTISGAGSMYDYNEDNLPWLLLRDTTMTVTLERGITHIGDYAFCGLMKLNKIELPNTLTSIGANAFAGCRKLYDIYSYATEPPVADNTSFTNYNVYLYVPCDNLRDYQMDVVFGSFKYIQCIEAENTTTDGQVSVTPAHNEAVVEWPTDGSAATYTLQITKDDVVFCTLVFNADGQLTNIAFAPARNGTARSNPRAILTQTGYRFTVTGLASGTRYTYDLTVKDNSERVLQSYSGSFTTKGDNITTCLDNVKNADSNGDSLNGSDTDNPRKVLRDGQVLILRNGKIYTTTGMEVQ